LINKFIVEHYSTLVQLFNQGNKSTGDNFDGIPNIDHTQQFVRKDIIEWLIWLRETIGFQDFRFDFTKG
jgi:alpha-amylase